MSVFEWFLELLSNLGNFINLAESYEKESNLLRLFIFEKINSLTDSEIKQLDKEVYGYFISYIKSIFAVSILETNLLIDQIVLASIYKTLTCGIFERRLKAASDLTSLLETKKKKQTVYIQLYLEAMHKKELLEWINQKEIVKLLLTKLFHEELLSRSTTIIIEAAAVSGLEELLIIWELYNEASILMEKTLEDLLKNVLQTLDPKLRIQFFNKIVDKTRFDDKYLKFITQYTKLFAGDSDMLGIPYMWEQVFGDNTCKNNQLLGYLCECLESSRISNSNKLDLVTQCVKNIESGRNWYASIKVLSIYVSTPGNIEIIKEVNSSNNLTNLILNNLSDYLKIVGDFPNRDPTATYQGDYNHKLNILIRLETILEVSLIESLKFTTDDFVKLWQIFENPDYTVEAKVFMDLLICHVNRSFGMNYGEFILDIFFNRSLINWKTMTLKKLNLFEELFNETNRNRKLMYHFVMENRYDALRIPNLFVILEIIKEAKDTKVKRGFQKFFTKVVVYITTFDKEYGNFYERMFEEIEKHVLDAIDNNDDESIVAFSEMILDMLTEIEEKGRIPTEDEYIPTKGNNEIRLKTSRKDKNTKINWDEEFYFFRIKVAYLYDISIHTCAFKMGDKIIDKTHDFIICKSLIKTNSLTLHEVPNPYSTFEHNIKKVYLESSLMNIMMNLLKSENKAYSVDVFTLVESSPADSTITEEVKNLIKTNDSQKWKSYFNDSNFYFNLYKLKTLIQLLNKTKHSQVMPVVLSNLTRIDHNEVIFLKKSIEFYKTLIYLTDCAELDDASCTVNVVIKLIELLVFLAKNDNVLTSEINNLISNLSAMCQSVVDFGDKIFVDNQSIIEFFIGNGKSRENLISSFVVKIVNPFCTNDKVVENIVRNLLSKENMIRILEEKLAYTMLPATFFLRKFIKPDRLDLSYQVEIVVQYILQFIEAGETDLFFEKLIELLGCLLKSSSTPNEKLIVDSKLITLLIENVELRNINSCSVNRIS